MANNKHLDATARSYIESMLNNKASFSSIAKDLHKDPSTISKEVRLHLTHENVGGFHFQKFNACAKRHDCNIKFLCNPCKAGRRYSYCRSCGMCNRFCKNFVKEECPRLKNPPYVCNACYNRDSCTLTKQYYRASIAQNEYSQLLSEARTGLSYSEDELRHFDEIISPLVKQNQSPHHICSNNRDSLMVSERTIYRLIEAGQISAKNIDLPRKVRYRSRKKKKVFKVDKACRIGRTFSDYLSFMEDRPDYSVVQMDSVEGNKGGKVLLTIHFVKAELMLAFIRDYNDSKSVTAILNRIYELVGDSSFRKLFPVILTDNGSEFSNPSAIEFAPDSTRRTHVFYCNPQASWQKGSAERNHEFIRCFIPKGKSFDNFSQEDISLMMNHINSYSRESLNDKSPYEAFEFLYGTEILDLLGCYLIPHQDVTLNSSIFRTGGETNALR